MNTSRHCRNDIQGRTANQTNYSSHIFHILTMKLLPLLILPLMAVPAEIQAFSKITTTVSGTEIPKELTKISFDGTKVTLTFSDNTTTEAEMNEVSVSFDYKTSAIDQIAADPQKSKGVYNLKGQYLGEKAANLTPGFYIINGQKIYIK